MYFVNLFGLWRENLMTLAQDLKATAVFAGVCGSMFLLRMMFGLSFSHVTMLR
jgi:hypothetical protein